MASHERLTDKTAVPQSVERLTAPREAVGSIPGGRTNTQGLKSDAICPDGIFDGLASGAAFA